MRWWDRQAQWRTLRRRRDHKPSRLVWFALGAAFTLAVDTAFWLGG
jgi:hypothetical protein